eukprot:CAMPEP_0194282836 /NCGR_PEP_ID=MMETSP0169-20130528/23993_1 /TAXON_ID=218684 /ORGANISM="Corethron pennatum, Strain L29A3" /LENGTH=317 /DNA_ID=CAMNT_0039028269 /DNA_START=115 /DNA_END=1065 /DNA_ORIENTATION=-
MNLSAPSVPVYVQVSRKLRDIRDIYTTSHQSRTERDNSRQASTNTLIAGFEQSYNEGKITLAALNSMKANFAAVASILENAGEEEEVSDTEKVVRHSFNHSDHGYITITSEGHQHWRKATTEDIGAIVLNVNNYNVNANKDGIFGELDDTEESPDEDFPDSIDTLALVYLQNGELYTSSPANNGVWEDLLVVPDQVISGVKNEAPPGSFFSGVVNKTVTIWTPAPEGKVWWDHPRWKGRYNNDFEYFAAKRSFEDCPGIMQRFDSPEDYMAHESKIWAEGGRFGYWDPVQKKFITAGERLRSEHWFHNGDGSAQQRW